MRRKRWAIWSASDKSGGYRRARGGVTTLRQPRALLKTLQIRPRCGCRRGLREPREEVVERGARFGSLARGPVELAQVEEVQRVALGRGDREEPLACGDRPRHRFPVRADRRPGQVLEERGLRR